MWDEIETERMNLVIGVQDLKSWRRMYIDLSKKKGPAAAAGELQPVVSGVLGNLSDPLDKIGRAFAPVAVPPPT